MNEMKKTNTYTNKDWGKLALLLSDEKSEELDILNRFIAEDSYNTEKQWKELSKMNSKKEINVDSAWDKVYSKMDVSGVTTKKLLAGISSIRWSIMKVAAVALIILSIGTAVIYINSSGILSKKITVVTGNNQKNLQKKNNLEN